MKGKKVGGRAKGTPNKSTQEIRDFLQRVYSNHLETLEDDLMAMKPFNRQQILDRLAAKFMPNLTKNEVEGSIENDITIRIVYDDDNDYNVDDKNDIDMD